MSRGRRAGLLLALLAPIMLAGQAAHAQQPGVVEGVVANGTTESLLDTIPVSLLVLRDTVPIDRLETVSDADGRFRFEGLEVSPDLSYVVSTSYLGVDYSTEPIDLSQPEAPIHLLVYETTAQDSDISILRASMAIPRVDSSTGLIQILEVVTFVNQGDRTYVGQLFSDPEQGGVLRLHLPPSSLDVSLGNGFGPQGPLPASDGMLGRSPVPPGEFLVVYAYKVPFADEVHTIEKLYAYPVGRATFLIDTSGPRPSSQQLTSVQTVEVNGVPNFQLSGRDFQPGERVSVTLTGLPSLVALGSSGGVELDTALRMAGVGAMAALLAGVTLYTVMSRRRRRPAPAGNGLLELHALDEERLALIASLAELDDDFEAGRLPKEAYEGARAGRRQRLMDVMLLMKERSGTEGR